MVSNKLLSGSETRKAYLDELKNITFKSEDSIMRAIILAGSRGMRLRPYTTLIPKPLCLWGQIFHNRNHFNTIKKTVLTVSHWQ